MLPDGAHFDVGEVFGDFQSHALALSNRAHASLANAFVEVPDRGAERASDLEEPTRRHAVEAVPILMQLLIGEAENLGKLSRLSVSRKHEDARPQRSRSTSAARMAA